MSAFGYTFSSLFMLALGLFVSALTPFGIVFIVWGLLQGTIAMALEQPGEMRVGWLALVGNLIAMILVVTRALL